MERNRFFTKITSDTPIPALSVSFLLSFSLGFFGPALLYYSNFYDFLFTFSDIFFFLMISSFLAGLLVFFFLSLFKGSAQTKAVCVVFAIGLGFYIQGNILIWNYGYFDGHPILWNDYLLNAVFESLIWISLILFSYIKAEKVIKFVTVCSIFLLFIQSCGLIAMELQSPPEPQWKNFVFDNTANQSDFSRNENVIIIILDTFQSDVFQEIINEDASYKNLFAGFTYYRNSVGGYPRTVSSVPLIMTGTYYENEVSFDNFVKYSYDHLSLTKTLSENGFNVIIYGNAQFVYPDKNTISNVKRHSIFSDPTVKQLYGVSVFRFLPHFTKEIFYPILTSPLILGDTDYDMLFYTTMQNKIRVSTDIPVFHLYHLNGPHYPFKLNEKLEYEELPDNREGFKEQSKASLQLTAKLIDELKIKGIYDKSLIIIVGDHGMQNNAYGINISQIRQTDGAAFTPNSVISGGIPLILVKPFNSNASLIISDAPVSLSDIPITVTTELNIPSNFIGNSMFESRESDPKERLYYHYTWDNSRWDNRYLPPMDEYSITNFSWYGSSWQPNYKTYSSRGIERNYPPTYSVNSTINVGKNEGTENFFTVGWSKPEENFVWSAEKSATIAFTMDNTNSDLILKITHFPLKINEIYEKQRISVFINKKEIGNYTVLDYGESENVLFVPHEYLNENVQYLSFIFPDAKSPYELGVSDDKRKISIGLTSVGLDLIDSGNLYFDTSWSSVENWSGTETRWLNETASIIIFSNDHRTTNLSFQAVSFYRTREFTMHLNNQEIEKVVLSKNIVSTIDTPLSLHKGENKIQLYVNGDCDRPVDIPELNSSDNRCLGIAIQNVRNMV